MFDLPDNPIGPYAIVELVSHHNIKSVRLVNDLGHAKYLIRVIYTQGHHRLIQQSDLSIYKSESDKRYRRFLSDMNTLSDEDVKNGGCRVLGNHRTDPETFPYVTPR